nr:protein kinase [Streptomyces sp. SID4913]
MRDRGDSALWGGVVDDYAGRVLADRYRLPLPPADAYELVETRAFDTYSGQEVLVRQVPLPEVVDAEFVEGDGRAFSVPRPGGRAVGRPTEPAVRRAIEAAQAAAQVPDHPRLDQVFDVFAEQGSLWIVSELVASRPLAALLAERPLNPFRAAEIGSDVLTALRVLHAHGWTHRNITVRTVLVCDDGRVVLTGLAAGAAEEALCGYNPVPHPDDEEPDEDGYGGPAVESGPTGPYVPPEADPEPPGPYAPDETEAGYLPASRGPAAIESGPGAELASPYGGEADRVAPPYGGEADPARRPVPPGGLPVPAAGTDSAARARAARAGAIAAYRAGARAAAARVSEEERRAGNAPGARPALPQPSAGADDERGTEPAPDAWPGRPQPPDDRDEPHGAGPDAWPVLPQAQGRVGDGRDVEPATDAWPVLPQAPRGAGETRGSEPATDAWPVLPQAPRGAEAVSGEDGRSPYRQSSGEGDGRGAEPATDAWPVLPQAPRGAGETRGSEPATDAWPVLPQAPGSGARSGYGRPGGEDFDGEGERTASRPALPQLPGGWVRGAEAQEPYDGYAYDVDDEEDDDEDEDGGQAPPRRLHLTGSWDDGPGSGRPVPAGGSGEDALRADASRRAPAPALPPATGSGAGRWDDAAAPDQGGSAYRGPATALAAERARQARIAVVGAVTERWAPEQAGPVHGNWQLAPPIGPATDLWALGALLYRAVQGHAPYPEDSAPELVQMVCGEPPAFAEECGPLRPVVESLLRQDPTERPDVEELSGWLRSLVRSAPEPEAGLDVVTLPAEDTARLPVVRRRGELVRKRRGRRGGAAHGRHRHTGEAADRTVGTYHEPRLKAPREPKGPKALRTPPDRPPRRLGRLLLVLILLVLVAVIAYAVMFMPKSDADKGTGAAPAPTASAPSGSATPDPGPTGSKEPSPAKSSGAQQPQTSRSAAALAPGYTLRKDAEGFEVGIPKGWQRSPANAERQVHYGSDGFSVLIVPGRDTAKANGSDPLDYQRDKEPELKPFRDSTWSSASGLRRTDVGRQAMAEGQFTWQDGNGREVYVRNLVMLVEGRYHVLQVIGPEDQRDRVTEIYQQASVSYRVTG